MCKTDLPIILSLALDQTPESVGSFGLIDQKSSSIAEAKKSNSHRDKAIDTGGSDKFKTSPPILPTKDVRNNGRNLPVGKNELQQSAKPPPATYPSTSLPLAEEEGQRILNDWG